MSANNSENYMMVDNNSSFTYCQDKAGALCDQVDSMIIDSFISAISIAMNFVHLTIIIKYSKPSNNRTTIVNLSILDVIRAVLALLLSNCPAQVLLYSTPALCTFSTIVNDVTISITLINLSMAAIDRYIAVCHPFQYVSHRLTRHYNKFIIAVWIVMSTYITFQNSLLDTCVLGSKMCTVYSPKRFYLLYLTLAFVICGSSLIIVLVCFIKIIIEFSSMAKSYQSEAQASMRMSLLLGLITALFFVFYLPLVFGIVAALAGAVLGDQAWSYLYTLITLNGVFNTVVYGWLKKRYRYRLKRLLCAPCKKNPNCVTDFDHRQESSDETTRSVSSKPEAAHKPTISTET